MSIAERASTLQYVAAYLPDRSEGKNMDLLIDLYPSEYTLGAQTLHG